VQFGIYAISLATVDLSLQQINVKAGEGDTIAKYALPLKHARLYVPVRLNVGIVKQQVVARLLFLMEQQHLGSCRVIDHAPAGAGCPNTVLHAAQIFVTHQFNYFHAKVIKFVNVYWLMYIYIYMALEEEFRKQFLLFTSRTTIINIRFLTLGKEPKTKYLAIYLH
jgi:hypothetical protein